MKIHIKDFNDINYRKITLFYGNLSKIEIEILEKKLKLDSINKLYRFNTTKENNLFYIENCDLQIVTDNETLEDLHNIYNLHFDGYDFYVYIEF